MTTLTPTPIVRAETFYTYLWLREDGTPYYVGKGHGKRAYRKGRPSLSCVLIQEFPSEADTFLAERFLISLYGRKDLGEGCLINHTDGGEGKTGRVVSEETHHRLSESAKRRIYTSEDRQSMSLGAKKRHRPCDTKTAAKISASLKNRPHSLERRRNIRIGIWRSRNDN